jgi:zinc protease
VVAGDITAAELKPLAERYYGAIPRGELPARVRPTEPPHVAALRVRLADARVRQPTWRRAYLAPSYSFGDKSQIYALEVGAEILGGGATSRMNRSLVIDNVRAVSTGAWYDSGAFGPTSFTVYASPQSGITVEDIEKDVEALLAKLLAEGATAQEVERAKKRMQASAVYARDSARRGAQALGAALASGQSVEDVESWPERIGAVTVEQVNTVLRAVLRNENALTGVLVETDKERP